MVGRIKVAPYYSKEEELLPGTSTLEQNVRKPNDFIWKSIFANDMEVVSSGNENKKNAKSIGIMQGNVLLQFHGKNAGIIHFSVDFQKHKGDVVVSAT